MKSKTLFLIGTLKEEITSDYYFSNCNLFKYILNVFYLTITYQNIVLNIIIA